MYIVLLFFIYANAQSDVAFLGNQQQQYYCTNLTDCHNKFNECIKNDKSVRFDLFVE